ncbi:MAG TPA: efflux RND transporter periplasmic adaptor subunit [Planctomycetaceae bacterium]|nr:efflux RND transporter periplasmic adaptor subunit [Planctomycetaceae bacterium]
MENKSKTLSAGGRPLITVWLWPRAGIVVIAIAVLPALGCGWVESHPATEPPTASGEYQPTAGDQSARSSMPRVDVVHPQLGGVVTSTTQPASVEAFHYANLFTKVSGYLKTQSVDIGARVKVGQLLATIDAPEIIQAAHQAAAELEQAQAQLKANEAALETAKANVAVAAATVTEKRADLKQAVAFFEFHQIQYNRMSDLFQQKAIDERAVDENRKERDSAEAAKNLAEAAVRTAQADLGAQQALEQQARANVADSRAKVEVASKVLEKANVYVSYTQIRSPYNGVVTRRDFHVGDFVRAAEEGGDLPVLTVAETDLMRIVVKMPEEYVPLTRPGDTARFRLTYIDHVFVGKVARIADSMDRTDKTMRTEIDLPNPKNDLRDGMYGYATIELSSSLKGLSIPSSSVTSGGDSKSSVFVVRDGRLKRVAVKVASHNGARVEILAGLNPEDLVVRKPADDLTEGEAVQAVQVKDDKATAAGPNR